MIFCSIIKVCISFLLVRPQSVFLIHSIASVVSLDIFLCHLAIQFYRFQCQQTFVCQL